MKKLSIAVVMMFVLSISTSILAAEVKAGAKVDAIIESEKELQNPGVFNAVLNISGKVNESVKAVISHNFVGATESGQENNERDKAYVAVKLGQGELVAGALPLPGLKNNNTIFNNTVLGDKFVDGTPQIGYSGDAGQVKYDISFYGGEVDGKGKPTNDAVIKVATGKDLLVKDLEVALVSNLDLVLKT
ncbi:MAG: hypothetical protein HY934_00540, partial [Candidatus Firestonebacteria bacterium]|nr:hypothetical protein [Candidatus Firestonebacteria bacterium]